MCIADVMAALLNDVIYTHRFVAATTLITSLLFMSLLKGMSIMVYSATACSNDDRKWTSPCGPNNSSFESGVNFTEFVWTENEYSMDRTINETIRKLREGQEMARNLREIYRHRVGNTVLTSALEEQNYHLAGFPVTELSDADIVAKANQNMTDIQLETYKVISTVAAFVEAIITDEEQFEAGEYSSRLIETNNKILDILCLTKGSITALGSQLDNYVTCEIVASRFRSIENRSRRYMRDFIIFKDIYLVYSNLIKIYFKVNI